MNDTVASVMANNRKEKQEYFLCNMFNLYS